MNLINKLKSKLLKKTTLDINTGNKSENKIDKVVNNSTITLSSNNSNLNNSLLTNFTDEKNSILNINSKKSELKDKSQDKSKEEINNSTSSTKLTEAFIDIPLSQRRTDADNPFKKFYIYIWDNQKRKTYTLLTMTFAFISILILFAIIPTLSSITEISKKIQDYKQVKTTQDIKLSNLDHLRTQYINPIALGGLSEYMNFFNEKFLPNSEHQELIYEDIIQKVNQSNINFINLSVSDNNTTSFSVSKNLRSAGYQLSIDSSDSSKIQNFISSMKLGQRLYTLRKIDILTTTNVTTTNSKNVSSISYTANISFLTYYYV